MPGRFTIVFLVIFVVSYEAVGQQKPFVCPEIPEDGNQVTQLAGEYFAAASEAFKKKIFKKAIRLFVSSLCVADHPNTVYNIAQSVYYVKKKKGVIKVLKAFVESREDAPSTSEIKKIVNRLEEQAGQEVSYPDIKAGEESHEVSYPDIEGDEETPILASVEVEEKPAPVQIHDEESPEVFLESGVGPAPLENEVQEQRLILGQTEMRFASFVLMGAGVAVLVAGIVLQGLSYGAKQKASRALSYDVFQAESQSRRKLQAGAVACFAIGGASAVTGLVLFLLDLKNRKEKDENLTVLPTTNGIILTVKF